MERLTKRVNDVVVFTKGKYEIGTLPVEMESWEVREVLYKLAEYEDAEEQGLLLRLPCKVGDTVYFTDRKYDRENREFVPFVHNGYVKTIKFSSRPTKITIKYEDRHGRYKGHDIHASNIGKTVFLTYEEAERALKGGVKNE